MSHSLIKFKILSSLNFKFSHISFISRQMSEFHLAEGSFQPPLIPGLMRLYSMKYCPFAQRTRLALLHKNIPHDIVNINLKKKPQWFLNKTPYGLVPVIENEGHIIYESSVCNDWLEETYPDPPLTNKAPYERAKDRIIMNHFDKIGANFYSIMKGSSAEKLKIFEKEVAFLEASLHGKFFGGDKPGIVDFHCWPWFERFPLMKTMRGNDPFVSLPKISQWMENMKDVPAVQKTIISPEEHLQFITSLLNKDPQYDFVARL